MSTQEWWGIKKRCTGQCNSNELYTGHGQQETIWSTDRKMKVQPHFLRLQALEAQELNQKQGIQGSKEMKHIKCEKPLKDEWSWMWMVHQYRTPELPVREVYSEMDSEDGWQDSVRILERQATLLQNFGQSYWVCGLCWEKDVIKWSSIKPDWQVALSLIHEARGDGQYRNLIEKIRSLLKQELGVQDSSCLAWREHVCRLLSKYGEESSSRDK